MAKPKNKLRSLKSIGLLLFGLATLTLVISLLLRGQDIALFNPKGPIAQAQLRLSLFAVFLLLSVALPTLVLLYGFAWQFRETNHKVTHQPKSSGNKKLVIAMWAVPSLFILVLAMVMWPATHRLDPHRSINSTSPPLKIQVVALRWKWLFIYPEQNIASVNFVQIPVNRPVQFELTADEAPMSSFWIPHLAGQLYAMTGHSNHLNLMADTIGDYPGSAAEINGPGFAGMKFTARASSQSDFDSWVNATQDSDILLDENEYQRLLSPSQNNPVASYAPVDQDLYAKMLMKYMGSHDHQPQKYESAH